ncbi:MAG TPA: hypothetical protein VMU00_05970 [Steroidobacteraceae bacterium]|nr:hypothetical protein [Steroidobacteraceae bacterium]
MSALWERLIVAAAVAASALYAFKALAPFGWRVSLARRLTGRLPDRVLIWLAGQSACDACGPRPAALPPRPRAP